MIVSALLLAAVACPQGDAPYLGEPIRYERTDTTDPVARLAARIAAKATTLARDERFGLLPALLDELDAPRETQALVFSKTSFQNALISPRNPRAIYFGDDVYVGSVPGSKVFELTGIDPEQGPIFYTLTDEADGPRIVRRDAECLRCHALGWTDEWPGVLVRSVHPDPDGTPVMRLGSTVTTHESPFAQRWGGWYVTGTHGEARHLGNVALDAEDDVALDVERGANVVDLSERCAIERHLTPHSDLVALMVLEHQTRAHDLIAQASYRARLALHRQAATDEALGAAQGAAISDATRSRLKEIADELLQYLLFRHEPTLPAPIAGTSDFAVRFAERGPRDRAGRSLRELDLGTRLFRWPVSYVIQGESFRRLPAPVLDIVLLRMLRILQGRSGLRAYGHLEPEQRRAVLEILADTLPWLPSEWRAAVGR